MLTRSKLAGFGLCSLFSIDIWIITFELLTTFDDESKVYLCWNQLIIFFLNLYWRSWYFKSSEFCSSWLMNLNAKSRSKLPGFGVQQLKIYPNSICLILIYPAHGMQQPISETSHEFTFHDFFSQNLVNWFLNPVSKIK
jgi:hypothetical protein